MQRLSQTVQEAQICERIWPAECQTFPREASAQLTAFPHRLPRLVAA